MSVFKKVVITATFFISFSVCADSDIQKTVLKYKNAMSNQDKKALKEVTTEELYTRLNKDKLLDRFFKTAPKNNKKYKLNIVESKVVKGYTLVEVSEKDEKHEGHKEWLKLRKTDQGYKVEELIHTD
ncbi:MAG: hypothetical protein KC478_10525 [Bacteriovoracaceae bacterium]|nr:hypothetical protein [Bacteriovoracaceae bacterium]